MSLNQDPTHIAHHVEKFFEIIRLKSNPVLYLQKPDLEKAAILPSQRDAIRIRNELGVEKIVTYEWDNKENKAHHREQEKMNLTNFLFVYPGLGHYYLGERK